MADAAFHVVLHEPEIPNNTGNIGRTCMATGCALHLIHPLAFDTSEKACRRAGLDYWPRLSPSEHASWAAYRSETDTPNDRPPQRWMLTTRASRPIWDAPLRRGDHLVFGKETRGLPDEMLDAPPGPGGGGLVTLPMRPTERSLNLATAVCAVIYEGLRQLTVAELARIDDRGRLLI